ncbi:MAG: TonB C-terminal domain-containing protein [Myxococcales bacterium]
MSDAATSPQPLLQSALVGRRTPAGRAVALSLAVHAALLGGFALLKTMEPPKLEPSQKPVSAKLVRLGKKRDEKLLPRKEQPPPPPPPKSVEVPVAAPVPSPAQPPKNSIADTKPAPAQARKSLFDAFAKTAVKPEELEGDPDGDPDGDATDAEEGEKYFGLILAKARRNYGVTKTIPPQELVRLKAEVVLYINATGDLIKDPVIQTSSGNGQFDQDVVVALKKAAPFGPPPKHLAQTLKTVGVAIVATP